jgi:hypothetical protein
MFECYRTGTERVLTMLMNTGAVKHDRFILVKVEVPVLVWRQKKLWKFLVS